jgi:hypothetical protein
MSFVLTDYEEIPPISTFPISRLFNGYGDSHLFC